MTKKEKEVTIQKAKDLGFSDVNSATSTLEYRLPFGLNTELWLDYCKEYFDISIWDDRLGEYIIIRKIESPEDLEMLFNAICPEKYRLPFG